MRLTVIFDDRGNDDARNSGDWGNGKSGARGRLAVYSRAERIVSESGLRHTFIRPNWFMQNFSIGLFAESIRDSGDICLPAADAKVSFVDTRDIAAVAVRALTERGHEGKGYTVTGGRAISHAEVADIISNVSGRSVTYTSISDDDRRRFRMLV